MVNIEKNKRYLIVTDACYRQAILNVRNQNPEWNFKLMTKDEFVSMVRFGYKKDPVPFLLTYQKEDYTTLKTYLRVLRFAKRGVNTRLDEIYGILDENGYIERDTLGRTELELYDEIWFFEGHEDFEMKNLFDEEHIGYRPVSFEDLGYEDRRRTNKNFYLYPDKLEQYCSLFSHIRKDIVENVAKLNDIIITVHSDSDDFYINRISKMFGVPSETRKSHSILSVGENADMLRRIQDKKSFTFSDEEKEKSRELYSIVSGYGLDRLPESAFDFAYLNLLEIIGASSISSIRELNGVRAESSISFKPNVHYYVTNFIHDDFYKIHSDSGCFTDEDLKKLGCNPSYVLTKMDRRKKKAFLTYMDVRFLSRVEIHQNDKMYNSQFVKDGKDESEDKEYVQVKKTFDEDGLYTKEASDFIRSVFASREKGYKETYDHSFSGVKTYKKDTFGVTSLGKYFECPFSYYMNNILYIDSNDPNADFFYAHFGTIVHHVFEKIHTTDDESFDFDKVYDEGIDEVRDDLKCLNDEDREHELALFEMNREHVRMFAINMRVQNKKGHIIDEVPEEGINFELKSEKTGNTYKITGKVDKLLYTSDEETGNNYWTLIDYKTGKESFGLEESKTVFLGNHLQLPLYYYYVSSDEKLNRGYTYGGFGIEQIFASSPLKRDRAKDHSKQVPGDHIKEYTDHMKLSGVYRADSSYLASFDGNTSDYLKSSKSTPCFTDVDGDASMSDKYEYSYRQMIEDAVNAAIDTMDAISECKFEIAPSNKATADSRTDGTHCSRCSFKNICYKDKDDIRDHAPDIEKKFPSNETQQEA